MENNKNEEGTKDIENNKNKEETKDIDRYDKIVECARKEIDRVHSAYRWQAGSLGIIIATGITIATFLIGGSFRDMKSSMNDEFQSMKSGVYADVNTFQRQVNNRIDEEFKTEKMQSLIKDTAREYTEKAAQQYIATEVNGVITPFKKEIQNTINDANAQIQKLNSLYHVLDIASHAKSGSKNAFAELVRYEAKEGTEESIIARDNLTEIMAELKQYRRLVPQSSFNRKDIYRDVNDSKKVCIQDDPIDTLVHSIPTDTYEERLILMEYISKKPKEEIFKTALTVFGSDSLPACAIFCGILSGISEEKADFLDLNAWTKICKKQVDKQ
jgi:hypothetical protein